MATQKLLNVSLVEMFLEEEYEIYHEIESKDVYILTKIIVCLSTQNISLSHTHLEIEKKTPT